MQDLTTTSRAALLIPLVVLAGCDRASQSDTNSASPAAVTPQASASLSAKGKVARIVFIDQEQACECTRNRIESSWTALRATLGPNSSVGIERIHRDTQEAQAEEYRLLRPLVTVPGIYLLDDHGAIVELLQGEVTQEQLRRALGAWGGPGAADGRDNPAQGDVSSSGAIGPGEG